MKAIMKIEAVNSQILKMGLSRVDIAYLGKLSYHKVCDMMKRPEKPVYLKTAKKFTRALGSKDVTDFFLPTTTT